MKKIPRYRVYCCPLIKLYEVYKITKHTAILKYKYREGEVKPVLDGKRQHISKICTVKVYNRDLKCIGHAGYARTIIGDDNLALELLLCAL